MTNAKMKPRYLLNLFLLFINLVSLYFIVTLFGYNEIRNYDMALAIGTNHIREVAYLFFFTTVFNLYFLSFVILEQLYKRK